MAQNSAFVGAEIALDRPLDSTALALIVESAQAQVNPSLARHGPQTAPTPARKLAALGLLAIQHKLWDQAIVALEHAHRLDPESVSVLIDLGNAYYHKRRFHDALVANQRVIAIEPQRADIYANIGSLLIGMGRNDLAIAASRIAIALDPSIAGAYINLATAIRAEGTYEEAVDVYKSLLARYPHDPAGLADFFYLRQHLCDWDDIENHLELVREHTFRKGHRVPVFSILVASPDPADHLLAAQVWVSPLASLGLKPMTTYAPRSPEQRKKRIKIGYLSNDFYNHATALLLIELLELRDREAFEVIGYSTGNLDDGTLIRYRIISAFDICYDLKDVTDEQAAQKIREDEIDILVDLKGFTSGARTEILAHRPAPIQVNFLGYPGTMGSSFVDYIIGDSFILPPSAQAMYPENIVRMPDCYQPNDRKRPISDNPVTRESCGLPEDAFVFCSFNAPYKITPAIYDIWMRLLHAVPGSVLWSLEGFGESHKNLQREAEKRGISGDRIILAGKLDTSNHLARMRLGDLFLDTLPVNAHTTASDALWVGLPVVTCAGEGLVSRVAGSLLHAVGVPELITETLEDYEAKALELARDPVLLQSFRTRIEANRMTAPLFDSERYTRHYESALLHMTALRDAGRPPEPFDVTPED